MSRLYKRDRVSGVRQRISVIHRALPKLFQVIARCRWLTGGFRIPPLSENIPILEHGTNRRGYRSSYSLSLFALTSRIACFFVSRLMRAMIIVCVDSLFTFGPGAIAAKQDVAFCSLFFFCAFCLHLRHTKRI